MSGRLPDGRARALQERLALHEAGQDSMPLAPLSAKAIREDWRQAREDVKRLVVMLRGDAVTRADGALCWCCDGRRDEACWDEPDGGSIFCRERRALLSEVAP